jgi:hypothetical protein
VFVGDQDGGAFLEAAGEADFFDFGQFCREDFEKGFELGVFFSLDLAAIGGG